MFEFAHNTDHTDIFLNVDGGGGGGGTGGPTSTNYNGTASMISSASLNGGNGLLLKRRASDNFFEHSHSHHDWPNSDTLGPPNSKRPHHSILFNNHLQSLAYGPGAAAHPAAASFFDYHHLANSGSFAATNSSSHGEPLFFGEKSSAINYRDDRDHRLGVGSSAGLAAAASAAELFGHRSRNGAASGLMNGGVGGGLGNGGNGGGVNSHQSHNVTSGSNERGGPNSNNNSGGGGGGDEEWKNIHTMLNCISAMVEKTKRAITILQQRGMDSQQSYQESSLQEVKRLTDEKVAEFKRSAEEAVNQVKRQAVLEIQRAVAVAENRALEIVAQERIKMEKLFADINNGKTSSSTANLDQQPPPPPDVVENNSNVSI